MYIIMIIIIIITIIIFFYIIIIIILFFKKIHNHSRQISSANKNTPSSGKNTWIDYKSENSPDPERSPRKESS